jgi:hypothetical protein
MIGAAVWLMLQTSSPTVGDTIWVSRTVAVPAGRTLRAGDWRPDDPIEVLGPPRIVERGDSTGILYPIVVWRPGTLAVEVPGPLLLGAGGGVDSLPPLKVTLQVASVLPQVPRDSTLEPQPRADVVPRGVRSILPLLLALAVAILFLAPLHWWWRRRGPATSSKPAPSPIKVAPPIGEWADAGEGRAVLASVTAGLRNAIALRTPSAHRGLDNAALLELLAAERPDWPVDEIDLLLRTLDEARFGVKSRFDVLALARAASALETRLMAGFA